MKKEKCILIIVLLAFELSYFVRFLFNLLSPRILGNSQFFTYLWFEDLTYTLEALSFMALLAVHFKNFRS